MEKLTNNIANKIASELRLDQDNKEVIAYGTFAILHTLLSIVLVFFFGLLFNVALEALIISFVTSILRRNSGGAHASTPGNCAIIGTILCVGQAVFFTFLLGPYLSFIYLLIFGFVTFTWSYCQIYRLAPVDSPAKPIKTYEKRKRMKKRSILTLSAYLVITLLIISLYILTSEKKLLTYVLCIYGGVVWQAFTLSKHGHLFLYKMDSFLNHITTFIRRRK